MKIKVTQEHIEKGEGCSAYRCPVALAVMDVCPGGVFIGLRVCYWSNNNRSDENRRAFLPPKARAFIREFDAGKPVQPFTFELTI